MNALRSYRALTQQVRGEAIMAGFLPQVLWTEREIEEAEALIQRVATLLGTETELVADAV